MSVGSKTTLAMGRTGHQSGTSLVIECHHQSGEDRCAKGKKMNKEHAEMYYRKHVDIQRDLYKTCACLFSVVG